jgi:hypothetical protein
MYLVSAAEAVEFRSDSLNEQVERKLKELRNIDPAVSVQFSTVDVGEILTCVKTFGAIQYAGSEEQLLPAPPPLPSSGAGGGSAGADSLPKIRFSVSVRYVPPRCACILSVLSPRQFS